MANNIGQYPSSIVRTNRSNPMPRPRLVLTISLVFLTIASVAAAHTLLTATGHPVNHYHFTGDCIPGTTQCASAWPALEKYPYSFRSQDRTYTGTIAWNCHGRTFDFRRSWVPLAEPFLTYDRPLCPAKPVVGDTVIWWYSKNEALPPGVVAGMTKHSVTIVGAWQGLDTLVMSKYGALGQYRHALRNAVAAYGANYSVTRFAAGTQISTSSLPAAGDNPSDGVRSSSADEMLAAREQMPWYDSVLEAETVFAAEHEKQQHAIGALRENTVAALEAATDPDVRLQLLLEDLRDPSHYDSLAVFNFPEPSMLTGFAAVQELTELASLSPTLHEHVLSQLIQMASDLANSDPVRAVALSAIEHIASPPERDHIVKTFAASGRFESESPSYTGYYAKRLADPIDRASQKEK